MSVYRDLSLTLKSHPGTKDVLKKTDVDAVKESIKTVLFNAPFDIPFRPNCGANLRSLLFEPSSPSTVAVAKRNMMMSISELEPRAVIDDLFIGDAEDYGIHIGVLFHVIGNPQQHSVNFTLERAR